MESKYSRRYICPKCEHKGRVSKAKKNQFIECVSCKAIIKANKIELSNSK